MRRRIFFNDTITAGLVIFLATLSTAVVRAQDAEIPPQPVYSDSTPICSWECLSNVALPNATIDSVVTNADGSCRVTVTVTHPPSGDNVRVWIALPMKGWNGRFEGTGGAGFMGGSPFFLSGPVHLGFAAGATDTGHEGVSGSFALDAHGRLNWQAIEDNAYLGIHDMTVVGKALVKAFYGKPPRYCYFEGFSTGGRQGLMEAQRYPDDYNGIVSGCPAINWGKFIMAELWPQVVMASSGDRVSAAKFRAATAAAIKACGGTDGITGGVIENPLRSTYNPEALIGKEIGESTFTEADADVVRRLWEGPRAQDGKFLWYGLSRGADLNWLAGATPFPIAMDWVRYFLVQDPKWNVASLTPAEFDLLFRQSVEEYGAIFDTDNPDLSQFRDHGGKIIMYHGLADQLIMTEGTIDYYKRVLRRMGGQEKVIQFARLFLVPGAGHGPCGLIGLDGAIVRWVEQGVAPKELTANGPHGRTWPLFPYPELAKYRGSGSVDDAENFVGVLPPSRK